MKFQTIVRHISNVKQQELLYHQETLARRHKKQKLMDYLEEQQDADLKQLSPKKLRRMIEELD